MYKYNSDYDSQMHEMIIPLLGFNKFYPQQNCYNCKGNLP